MSVEAISSLSGKYREVAEVLGWEKAYAFGRAVWEKKRAPSRLESKKGRGGQIYIPKTLDGRVGRELLDFLPHEDAKKLVRALGPGQLEFGKPLKKASSRRDQTIADNLRDGWSVQHVACLFGINEKTVRDISKKRGLKAKDCLPDMRALRAERLAGLRSAVLNAYRTGSCIYSAAYTWGYDPDSADQIVQEFGNEPAVSESDNSAEVSANAPIARAVPIGLVEAYRARLAALE